MTEPTHFLVDAEEDRSASLGVLEVRLVATETRVSIKPIYVAVEVRNIQYKQTNIIHYNFVYKKDWRRDE